MRHTKKTKQILKEKALIQFKNGMPEQTKKKIGKKIRKAYKEGRLISPTKGKFKELNPHWKGGEFKDEQGYINVYNSKKQQYYFEHRIIMEKHLGRKLESWEQIHHKNGIKDDNRLENLEIVVIKKHFGQVRCPKCLYDFLIK